MARKLLEEEEDDDEEDERDSGQQSKESCGSAECTSSAMTVSPDTS